MADELGDLRRVVNAALLRAQALPPVEAVEAAERLSEALKRATSDAALMRARAAAKVRSDGNLSLAELAAVMKVSRSRAAQLVQAADANPVLRERVNRKERSDTAS